MRIAEFVKAAPGLSFLFLVLVLSTHAPTYGFDFPPDWDGDTLTTEQVVVVLAAILNIADGPPDSISYMDEWGVMHSVSLDSIAKTLANELANGDIEQEVQNDDAGGGQWMGEINVNDDVLDDADDSVDGMEHLQEILVHESIHKMQEGIEELLRCWECSGNEVEATGAELAYKDSILVPWWNNHYKFALDYWSKNWNNFIEGRYAFDNLSRVIEIQSKLIIEPKKEEEPESDKLKTYHSDDEEGEEEEFSLAPLEITDYDFINSYFPNGDGLFMACGFIPGASGALLTYEVSGTGIVGLHTSQVFAPYFYGIERAEFDNSYIITDTATTQLYRLEDSNSDGIPDMLMGLFATVAQFPQLAGMRSVATGIHPVYGAGLIVSPEPPKHFHHIRPYDERWFLVDSDGDHVADACYAVRRCEFIESIPQIRAVPYVGDMEVTVFGTWQHDIAVHRADETGEILFEMLGVVNLEDSIQVACSLIRPLLPGEYIIAVDLFSGERSGRSQPVRERVPEAFVIRFDSETGVLRMDWECVPGAWDYALYASDDGIEFYDTGLRTVENYLEIPLPPMERQFFRVTAEQ